MKKKLYNIALIPKKKSKDFINCAQNFSNIADRYLLGEGSMPHITICKFENEESEIKKIWMELSSTCPINSLPLYFNEFSCITFDNKIYWASLMPNNREKLFEIQKKITQLLKIENKTYDPHLTLINTKNENYQKVVERYAKTYKPIVDDFIFALGVSDDIGQLVEVICTFKAGM